MNRVFLLVIFLLYGLELRAETSGSSQFHLTKINRNFLTAPQFVYSGAQQYPSNQRDRWLEVEVEFKAAPEQTDELTFRYLILVNETVLSGEVTHVNIAAGPEQRSVMYVSPRALTRCVGNRTPTPALVRNICVQIVHGGATQDELSMIRGKPDWYSNQPRVTGLLLNKNQTPFAPLYWDRYAQIKNPP